MDEDDERQKNREEIIRRFDMKPNRVGATNSGFPERMTIKDIEEPASDLRVYGANAPLAEATVMANHINVGVELYRVGFVRAVVVHYDFRKLDGRSPFATTIIGADGMLTVYGYTIGNDHVGHNTLLALLHSQKLLGNATEVTRPIPYQAGVRSWLRDGGFVERSLEIR